MANEKKKQEAPFYKKANGDFRGNKGTGFQNGGSAVYQPRDANTGRTGQGAGRKKQTEKSMQAQQETFGQKVQKPGAKPLNGLAVRMVF